MATTVEQVLIAGRWSDFGTERETVSSFARDGFEEGFPTVTRLSTGIFRENDMLLLWLGQKAPFSSRLELCETHMLEDIRTS